MLAVLQTPQELSTARRALCRPDDLQKSLPTPTTLLRQLGQQLPHFSCDKDSDHGSVQHTVCLGQSNPLHNRRKMNVCIRFTGCPSKHCLGTSDAEEAVWASLSCLLCAKFPCVPVHLEMTLLLPLWHTSPFSRDAFSLEESLTSATTRGCSLASTLAAGKTYGNNFFSGCFEQHSQTALLHTPILIILSMDLWDFYRFKHLIYENMTM